MFESGHGSSRQTEEVCGSALNHYFRQQSSGFGPRWFRWCSAMKPDRQLHSSQKSRNQNAVTNQHLSKLMRILEIRKTIFVRHATQM